MVLTLILLILSFGMIIYFYYDYPKSILLSQEHHVYCGVVDIQSNLTAYTPEQLKGQAIFKNKCSVCHAATDEVLVGPGLKGIAKRRPMDWIVRWVNNPKKVIESGDKYAVGLFKKFNYAEMTSYPNLKREEIISIITYIDNQ